MCVPSSSIQTTETMLTKSTPNVNFVNQSLYMQVFNGVRVYCGMIFKTREV